MVTETLTRILRHWFLFFVLFGVVLIAISGLAGNQYGITWLFRDDPAWVHEFGGFLPRLANGHVRLGQTAAVILIGCLLASTLFLEQYNGRVRGPTSYIATLKYLAAPTFVLGLLPFLAFAFPLSDTIQNPNFGDFQFAVIGQIIGWLWLLLLITVGHFVSAYFRFPRIWAFIGAFLTLAVFTFVWPKVAPAVSIIAIFGLLSVYYLIVMMVPASFRVFGLVIPLAVIVATSDKFTYRLDGISNADGKSYYDKPRLLADIQNSNAGIGIDQVRALTRWGKYIKELYPEKQKPKLVIVSTSGGAYRAAFWTAMILDKLKEESADPNSGLTGITDHIRLITGASGGMVAGAYFSVMQNKNRYAGSKRVLGQILQDVRDFQTLDKEGMFDRRLGSKWPVPGDSLSPVVQQFMQRDILASFATGELKIDRGKILEQQWATLRQPFSAFAAGERRGRQPSLIFSPMVVETGQQLLISNLNLSKLNSNNLHKTGSSHEYVEFFNAFPGAEDHFTVAEAVRMSATFPYISPVVDLPTEPPVRFVDAGYYDNYGISVVISWLRVPEIRRWLLRNTAGVMIVQIRAFPDRIMIGRSTKDPSLEPLTVGDEKCHIFHHEGLKDEGYVSRALQWATTPLQAAGAARERSMLYRNNRMLSQIMSDYHLLPTSNGETEQPWVGENGQFIQSVVFQNKAHSSLNWYVHSQERTCMEKYLSEGWRSGEAKEIGYQLNALKSFWKQ